MGPRLGEDREVRGRLHRLRASKDGTRFLVQGHAEAPILVSIIR